MSRKNLSLIVGAASLAMAAAFWSLPVIAGSACATLARASLAHPTWSAPRGANLANPKPGKDDDDSGDMGDDSGDATPVPDPQPAAGARDVLRLTSRDRPRANYDAETETGGPR